MKYHKIQSNTIQYCMIKYKKTHYVPVIRILFSFLQESSLNRISTLHLQRESHTSLLVFKYQQICMRFPLKT